MAAGSPSWPRKVADDHRLIRQVGMAVRVAEVGVGQRHQLARAQHDLGLDQHVPDLPAVGAAVHPDEAADGAGDGAEELDAGDPRIAGSRGDQDSGRSAAAAQRQAVEPLNGGKGFSKPDDHARHPAVPDNEVGAKAECHHRNLARQLTQELLQVGNVRGLEQPLGSAAGLEPDEWRERG